jgi:hypothetical protein
MKQGFVISCLVFVLGSISGCGRISDRPKGRFGSYAAATALVNFEGLEDLGTHGTAGECNALLYTCRGGHIDLSHLRKSADFTRYFGEKIFAHLMSGRSYFSLKMKEPSVYYVRIAYPSGWGGLTPQRKEEAAWNCAIDLAAYISYTGITWHEIITWFGYSSVVIPYTESGSAFAWEDGFSNFLGAHLGAKALRNAPIRSFDESTFNRSMTAVLNEELRDLGVQPASVARRASGMMDGVWYSSFFLYVKMKKMHLDTGFDDGDIAAWIVPSLAECKGATARTYRIPSLEKLQQYGFSAKLEIDPEIAVGGRIRSVAGRADRIVPDADFPKIIENIRQNAAVQRGDPNVDRPY